MLRNFFALFCLLLFLTACGGSSSGSDSGLQVNEKTESVYDDEGNVYSNEEIVFSSMEGVERLIVAFLPGYEIEDWTGREEGIRFAMEGDNLVAWLENINEDEPLNEEEPVSAIESQGYTTLGYGHVVVHLGKKDSRKKLYIASYNIARGTNKYPYYIYDYNTFSKIGLKKNSNKYYKLGANLYLPNDYTPIENFVGILDGQNYTINNVRVNNKGAGVFDTIGGYDNRAVVKNLKIKFNPKPVKSIKVNSLYIDDDGVYYNYGILAGYIGNANIDNVIIDGDSLNFDTPTKFYGFGGLASSVGESTITNCHVKNLPTNIILTCNSGGLFGIAHAVIENSSAELTIDLANESIGCKERASLGGLVGWSESGPTIKSSFANLKINAKDVLRVGGLVGEAHSGKIVDSSANLEITAADKLSFGGLIYSSHGSLVVNNQVNGTVKTINPDSYVEAVGGIAAFHYGRTDKITGIFFTHSDLNILVNGNEEGVVGGIAAHGAGPIAYSYSTGNITGKGLEMVGGLVGEAHDCEISFCYATGNILGSESVGGVAGAISINAHLNNVVALNKNVSSNLNAGENVALGRIFGKIKHDSYYYELNNNFALHDMNIKYSDGNDVQIIKGSDTKDGSDLFPANAAQFDPRFWMLNSEGLPILKSFTYEEQVKIINVRY